MKQFELPVTKPVFRLKGGTLAATVLELASNAPQALATQLAQKVAQSPQLLRHSPLIIALDKLGDADGVLDLAALLEACRALDLQPVAVRALRSDDIERARALGIAVLPPSRARERDLGVRDTATAGNDAEATAATAAPPPAATLAAGSSDGEAAEGGAPLRPARSVADGSGGAGAADAGLAEGATPAAAAALPEARPVSRPTRVVTQPVRGGQQVYADGDLVLLAPVSAGAEVIAEGHIHCYAPLRGRALAGVSGDASARLFCRELAAELVSIAGRYRIAEDLKADPLWGHAVQFSLRDDQLTLAAL